MVRKMPKLFAPTATLALQTVWIAQRFPTFRYSRENGEAVWRGTLQPRGSSPAYKVAIHYRIGKSPTVKVVSPKLVKGAPHLYKEGVLCLYWPKEWRWSRDQFIATTILPWTASWLYFYELWLDTGKWLGPSSHDPAFEAPV